LADAGIQELARIEGGWVAACHLLSASLDSRLELLDPISALKRDPGVERLEDEIAAELGEDEGGPSTARNQPRRTPT
jgi:hypothetical protein